MADNESAPAGEQPLDTPTNTPAGEQPQIGDLSAAIRDLDATALADLLVDSDGTAPSSQEQPSAPAPQVDPAPQGEQPAAATDEAPEAAPAPGDQPKGAPSRIRTGFLPPDQQTLLNDALTAVKTGKAADIPSAIALLTGTPVAAPAPSTDGEAAPVEAAPATPAPAAESPEVTALETELRELRDQRREARKAFDTDTDLDLTEKIEDATAKLALARSTAATAAQQAQVQRVSYENQFDVAVTAVESKYPQALDDSSAFSRILTDRVDAAKLRGDAALSDPNFIMAYADEVAADLGLNNAAPTPIPPAPARAARPTGQGLAPGHQTASRLGLDQIRAAAADLDSEALGDAIFTT